MFTKNGWSEKIVRFLFAVSPGKASPGCGPGDVHRYSTDTG